VRAPPDGHTLLLITVSNAINVSLYDNLNYDFMRDIVPIGSIMRTPGVMEVNPSVPAKTAPDFIAYAKANPHKITMASAGNGASSHLAGELFMLMTGIDMIVPFPAGSTSDTLAERPAVHPSVSPQSPPKVATCRL
jgi:tripartite-type tricarboxylate transporter receptor subunit TctC